MKLRRVLLGICVFCSLATIASADGTVPSSESETANSSEGDMKERYRKWYREVCLPSDKRYKNYTPHVKKLIERLIPCLAKQMEAAKMGDGEMFEYLKKVEMLEKMHDDDKYYEGHVYSAKVMRGQQMAAHYNSDEIKNYGELGEELRAILDTGESRHWKKCVENDRCRVLVQKDLSYTLLHLKNMLQVIEEEESKKSG